MTSGSWTNKLIILATISLPVAPVIADYFGPATTARWMLAQAANEFDQGNVEEAQRLLETAYGKSEDLATDRNFWKQLERIQASDSSERSSSFMTSLWEKRIRQIEAPGTRAEVAFVISSLLSNRKQFDEAVRILSENLPAIDKRSPTQNNQIAYMRALAGTELDQALLEVDTALKSDQNESFLDTKGWILHRMGRDPEALEAMDKSLAMLTQAWSSQSSLAMCLAKINELQSQAGEKASEKPKGWGVDALLDEFPQLSRRLPELLDMQATLRLHRLRVCEALGKTDQVHDEAAWLHAFSHKELEELF
jgi:tetratricopeptide (TPR) repeat protein